MTDVLRELRVEVERYNIFEDKNAIATLPSTLKGVDGVILATTVEWFGIGGFMQQFLDMCWLYADKQELSHVYMLPVVMATTYGERDAELSLVKAWETLGGIPITGLVAYVENLDEFEKNEGYRNIIEKKTETLYRTIHQKTESLPTSNLAVKTNILKTRTIELTPQESEQLSKFVSDETYVKQQKEDIEELSAIFKRMMYTTGDEFGESGYDEEDREDDTADDDKTLRDKTGNSEGGDKYISAFTKCYSPVADFQASYAIVITDENSILHIDAMPDNVKVFYAATEEADVLLKTTARALDDIIAGKGTFQRGFMVGEITVTGRMGTLRKLDVIFPFQN
ncbi:MAG: SCP2 sterol-binding domain-containing protein [Lachnospiraceae bacterium]|nr:SCP2 sterol-binding domain-containing protein [Lachnospiraceae bacterium]